MNRFFLFCLLLVYTLSGCNNDSKIYFYSADMSQCITVIDIDTLRYIINGKHNLVPEKDYILLRTDKITDLADGIELCWRNDEYEWDIVCDKSIIIENRLDTLRFKFSNALPTDSRGIPNAKKFRKKDCSSFDFYRREILYGKSTIIEIK